MWGMIKTLHRDKKAKMCLTGRLEGDKILHLDDHTRVGCVCGVCSGKGKKKELASRYSKSNLEYRQVVCICALSVF